MQPYIAPTIAFLSNLSEADLQKKIIEPLLRKQGFYQVRDNSGPLDRGKDLVAMKDEFGKRKLYAIQIKKLQFSGNHRSPNAMTAVLVQLRQTLLEPVIDATINIKRIPDRCLFITPFQINVSAFESALSQIAELERREITIVDGPLLADMVLAELPEILRETSHLLRYRMELATEADKVREASALMVSRELSLDSIYVELRINAGDRILEQLRDISQFFGPVILHLTQAERVLLETTHREWTNVELPLQTDLSLICPTNKKEFESLYKPQQQRLRDLETELSNKDIRLRERNEKTKELEELKNRTITEINLDTIKREFSAQALKLAEKVLSIPSATAAQANAIIAELMEFDKKLKPIRNNAFFTRLMPEVFGHPLQTTGAPIRIPASSVLKLNVPCFISGPPGAGKTTLMRRLAQTVARESDAEIPTLTYLVEFQNEKDIDLLKHLQTIAQAKQIVKNDSEFFKCLTEGKFRIFLDGLDEAGRNAPELAKQARAIKERFPRCSVLITARETLENLIWEGAFHIKVAEFDDIQLGRFLEQWFTSAPTKIKRLKAWLKVNPEMAKAARTPIIAALLCSLSEVDEDLPTTETELYQQRFDLLLGKWEQAKGIDPLPRRIRNEYWHFLMSLAWQTHERGYRSMSYDEVTSIAREFYSERFHKSAAGLVFDAIHRGLLEIDKMGNYSFGHLTYQEFLAAKWASHQNCVSIIWERLGDVWWSRVWKLYAGMKMDLSSLLEYAELRPREEVDIRLPHLSKLIPFATLSSMRDLSRLDVRVISGHAHTKQQANE